MALRHGADVHGLGDAVLDVEDAASHCGTIPQDGYSSMMVQPLEAEEQVFAGESGDAVAEGVVKVSMLGEGPLRGLNSDS